MPASCGPPRSVQIQTGSATAIQIRQGSSGALARRTSTVTQASA